MATEIVISNGDYIKVDNFYIKWADKGDSMPALPSGQPGDNNIHYIIYNTLSGDNEIQHCGPSGKMKGNTDLNSTSDIVTGTTTVQNLLDWGQTRKDELIADPNYEDPDDPSDPPAE